MYVPKKPRYTRVEYGIGDEVTLSPEYKGHGRKAKIVDFKIRRRKGKVSVRYLLEFHSQKVNGHAPKWWFDQDDLEKWDYSYKLNKRIEKFVNFFKRRK